MNHIKMRKGVKNEGYKQSKKKGNYVPFIETALP